MATSMQRSRISSLFHKITCKRPSKRNFQPATALVNDDNESPVEYPTIKPKYPPGRWGELIPKMAWKMHEEEQKMKSMLTLKERHDYLATQDSKYGSKLWKYQPIQSNIGLGDYQQDKTKTLLIEGPPDSLNKLEIDLENEYKLIKDIVIDKLLEEHEILCHKNHSVSLFERREHNLSQLLQSIIFEIIVLLSQKLEHCNHLQIDPNIEVSACWDRFGVRPFKPRKKDYVHSVYAYKGPLSVKYDVNFSKYQSAVKFSCQLRSANPLPEFLSLDDERCTSVEYPKCTLWPNVLGTRHEWIKPKWDPGYSPQDPYQFVNLSFLSRSSNYIELLNKQHDPEAVEEMLKLYGMNAAFISTVAQAHNQGFNTYTDITYPFTTQTVLTDGRLFSVYSYQLNTLHLWKDDEANPLRNICFIQQNLPLYDVIENGEVKGFNDETFKALLKCFVLKPEKRDFDLRPNIPLDSPDRCQSDNYIPEPEKLVVVEEKVVYDDS